MRSLKQKTSPAIPEPLQYLSVTGTGKPVSAAFAALAETLHAKAYHIQFRYGAGEKTCSGICGSGPAPQNLPGTWQYSLWISLPDRATGQRVAQALCRMAETRRAGILTSACIYRHDNPPAGRPVRTTLFGHEPGPEMPAAGLTQEKNETLYTGLAKALRTGLKNMLRQPLKPGFS